MINLLPPKRLLNMRLARTNTILRRYIHFVIIGLIVIVASLGAAYYFLNNRQQNVRTVLEDQQKQVSELEPMQKEAESLSVTVDTIASLFARNIIFSDMLTNIGANMPDGAVLTGMQFSIENADAPFVISAEIEDEAKAAILQNNLKASGLFDSVEIKSITKKEEKDSKTDSNNAQQSTGTSEAQEGEATQAAQPEATKESRYKYTTILNTTLKTVEAAR